MKKRKNFRIDPNDPFSDTRARFHGAPTSETEVIGRRQKVKFEAPEKASPRSYTLESEREKVTACVDADAKTSEYAFFKKFKKDASSRSRSGPLRNDSCLLSKKPRSSDCSRERIADVRIGSKSYRSSKIIEDVLTPKTDSFLSPSAGTWNKSDLYFVSDKPKDSQGWGDTTIPHGNWYVHGEIFSRKRQKLRQCVADALSVDTEKLCSKRHDIVSILLSRLFPVSIEENRYDDPNPEKVVNAKRYDLPDSRESDVQFKEHYQIPKRKLLDFESNSYFSDHTVSDVQFKEHYQIPKRKLPELESTSYFSDHLLSPMFLRSDEIITPHTEFPTYHSHKFQPLNGITEPECQLSGTSSFSATAKSDLTCGSLFNEVANATRYGLFDSRELNVQCSEQCQIPKKKFSELESSSYFSDHLLSPIFLQSVGIVDPHAGFPTYPHKFETLLSITEAENQFGRTPSSIDTSDEFLSNDQNHETFTLNYFKETGKLEKEPIPLLLEKDFDCMADEINVPVAYKYAKPDNAPALSILDHGEEHTLGNTLEEYNFSPSSSLRCKSQGDINSIFDSGFFRYQEFRFGKYICEDFDKNFNRTALSSSHNKHYFQWSEKCNNDISCVQDSIHLSPFQHWVRRTVSSDYHHHHPDLEAWSPSSLDEYQRCLPLTSSSPNYQSSNSRTLHLPQRESISSVFHPYDNYEPELDGGNHREVVYHFTEGFFEMYNSPFLRMTMQRNNGGPFPLDRIDYINEQEEAQKMLL